jgi:hypothetical protein
VSGVLFKPVSLDLQPENHHIEPVDPAVWTRDQMHGMYLFTGISRGLSEIHPPLGYPKPEDEFFGLTEERKREANGKPRQGTRDLVTGAGWYATALIAHRCGIIVTRKIDVPSNYQQHVGDIWSPFVEELFTCCRDRWSYRIPSDPKDRQTLRRLCVQSQEFENHFLAVYRDFLMAELRSSVDAARQDAHRALERLPYRDSGGDTARAAMLGEDQ